MRVHSEMRQTLKHRIFLNVLIMHAWWFQIVHWSILYKIYICSCIWYPFTYLKKVKPNEVRKIFYHLLRYLSHFYVILWPLKFKNYSLIHPNIEKLYVFFIRKKFSTKWCTFYYFVSLPSDKWHDLTIFQIFILFFAAHSFFNLKNYWNMFWKALDLGYLVTTILAEKSRIFRG